MTAMDAIEPMVANLERQHAHYADLERLIEEQRDALLRRDVVALEAINERQSALVESLATLERERQSLLGALSAPVRHLSDLIALSGDSPVRERVKALCEAFPRLVESVARLTRLNRVLAADANASVTHLLELLGIGESTDYSPRTRQVARRGPCLRLDVTA